MLPLDGIKVLDFSTLLPGPLAGLVLAEAGADVIKVERAEFGEEMRYYQPKWGKQSATFCLLNRGKKSLSLDLKQAEHIQKITPLLKQADILIEQFRPGVMERLGIGYETVKTINPKLIYCSITGYGQTGPKSQRAGHDLNYVGDTGLLDLSIGQANCPTVPPALVADLAGGTYPALVNILMALVARQKTNQGCHLDIAMSDHMFMLMSWALAQGQAGNDWPASGKGLLTGGSPRYQIYPTKDGKFIAAAPLEQKFWLKFCQAIGLAENLITQIGDQQNVIKEIAGLIVAKKSEEWEPIFQTADCCCTIVKSLSQAIQDNHFAARGLFDHTLENEQGAQMAALPVCLVPAFRRKNESSLCAPDLATGPNLTEFSARK